MVILFACLGSLIAGYRITLYSDIKFRFEMKFGFNNLKIFVLTSLLAYTLVFINEQFDAVLRFIGYNLFAQF